MKIFAKQASLWFFPLSNNIERCFFLFSLHSQWDCLSTYIFLNDLLEILPLVYFIKLYFIWRLLNFIISLLNQFELNEFIKLNLELSELYHNCQKFRPKVWYCYIYIYPVCQASIKALLWWKIPSLGCGVTKSRSKIEAKSFLIN